MDPRGSEVRRLLERYLVEIVETYELCPWARAARQGGELGLQILWGQPAIDMWVSAAETVLAAPTTRVAMVVAPELAASPAELRTIRDAVAARVRTAGIADFHPEAALDLATPARLVPFFRRSPDPMLQLVPFAILDEVRGAPPIAARAHQAQILGGHARDAREPVTERIAAANHGRAVRDHEAIAARLADLAADRRVSYARVGISTSR